MKLKVSIGLIVLLFSTLAFAGNKKEIPITTDSKAAMTLYIAGQAAADVGNGTEANRLFRAATEADPSFARAWLQVGNNAFSGGEFNAAMTKAESLAKNASKGEALLININLRFMDNNFVKQVELAEELVAVYPDSPRAWLTLSNVQAGLNRFEDSRKSAKKAIDLNSGFTPAYLAMGNSLVFNDPKDFTKAEHYFKKAIALQPGEDNHYWGLGDVYRASGKLQEAADFYRLSTLLDANNGTAFVKLGHVNSFLGNYDDARENYERGIDAAQPEGAPFLANYKHFTWVHANNPKAGVEGLKKLYEGIEATDLPTRQKTGAMIFTLTNAAMICMDKDMHDEADELLEMRGKLLRADAEAVGTPEFSRIQEANIVFFKGRAAASRGDLRTAQKMAKENKKLVQDEENPRKMEPYHQLMGLIYLEQHKPGKAVAEFRKADLTNIYVKYHLAVALEDSGDHDEAEALFKEVADWNFNSVGYALVRKAAIDHSS
ncbi:MAG: tetratricopeptide repeat protein [Gammaproteobacteria bacterium]|nr:tetratricopeptide repeat protein [Gammaproteobacteria bacterium]